MSSTDAIAAIHRCAQKLRVHIDFWAVRCLSEKRNAPHHSPTPTFQSHIFLRLNIIYNSYKEKLGDNKFKNPYHHQNPHQFNLTVFFFDLLDSVFLTAFWITPQDLFSRCLLNVNYTLSPYCSQSFTCFQLFPTALSIFWARTGPSFMAAQDIS